jgi:oligopeptide transport system permease protein
MTTQSTTGKQSYVIPTTITRPPRSLWSDAWRRLLRNKAAVAGAIVIAIFAIMALFAPLIAPHNPIKIYPNSRFLPPAWETSGPTGKAGRPEFLLGTDSIGRDVFSRLIYGARVSMIVGLVPTLIILVLGVTIGLISAYAGGWLDNLLMRFGDIIYAFPDLLFFIIVMAALRETPIGLAMNGLLLLFVALSIVNWVGLARLVRGSGLSLKQKEFVEAGRMIGAPSSRIMLKHLLPNTLGIIIVYVAFRIPALIITEAVLGYLGLGLRPSTDPNAAFITSWGSLLLDGQTAINAQPWLLLAPAICVALVVLAFNYLGDGLRDALDPRLSGTE